MADAPRRLTGWHVLGALVAFFGITIAVNVAFIYFAVTTFSGVETENAYKRGVAYNQQYEVVRREAALGWQGTLAVEGGVPVLTLVDKSGRPLSGMHLAAKVGRPSVDRFDRPLAFREPAAGRYIAETAPLAAGAWMAVIEVRDPSKRSGDPSLRIKERLWVSR
ncbi:MAG: FixH family protein [Hyphomicrobiaceae bacterium]